jgi:hypothetical protein
MRKIAETNILVRTRVELPHGLRMATEEFREGWNFTRSVDARRLQKRILKHGWNLVRNSSGLERSGVGPTSQHAVAGALTLALRRLTAYFNAVEIEHIASRKVLLFPSAMTPSPWPSAPGRDRCRSRAPHGTRFLPAPCPNLRKC